MFDVGSGPRTGSTTEYFKDSTVVCIIIALNSPHCMTHGFSLPVAIRQTGTSPRVHHLERYSAWVTVKSNSHPYSLFTVVLPSISRPSM